jgi:atypical dual specificity phosphatase
VGQRIGRPAVTLRRYLLDDEEAPGSAADSERFVPLHWHFQLPKLIDRLDDVLGSPALRLSDGEWWRLAIARELLADPPLLCVDEPTAGLTEAEAQPILSLLRAEGQKRCVLMVSHNQQHVRECCDHVILLAAGQVQDSLPAAEFFEQPRSKAAQDYVRTGGCSVASPDAGADELEPDPPVDAMLSDGATLLSVPHPPEQPGAGVLWETPTPVLRLRDFGVRFGVHEVLRELNLDIAPCRIHLLVTPEGLAKRMLLRALCGAPAEPLSRVGQALYRGAPLGAGNLPALATPDLRMIQQSAVSYLFARIPTRESFARENQRVRAAQLIRAAGFRGLADRLEVPVSQIALSEWRALDALSAASTDPALLCLDEPLSRLPPMEQEQLHELLCHLASFRALLIFVQDPTPYLLLRSGPGPRVGYLIDGTLSAERPGEEPAVARTRAQAAAGPAPPSVAGSGSAARPAVSEDAPEHPSRREVGSSGPRGFQWLREGALAGMPLPGLSASLDYDLGLLRSAGVTHLITLTTTPLPAATLSRYGLRGVFFPIEDMGAPPIDAAAELCTQLSELLAAGQVLCFHCKAGYGRTGTLLASLLVWEGTDARTALARVRAVNPNWVQSSRQETFLAELAERRSRHRSPRTGASTHTAGSARSPKRTA